MQSKSCPKTVGWYPGNCAQCWWITNTSCVQAERSSFLPGAWSRAVFTERNKLQWLMCSRGKFFLLPPCSLLVSTHTTEQSWVSPWSCASDVSNNVSSRKCWRSPLLRLSEGSTATLWTPGASTTSATSACFSILFCICKQKLYDTNTFRIY